MISGLLFLLILTFLILLLFYPFYLSIDTESNSIKLTFFKFISFKRKLNDFNRQKNLVKWNYYNFNKSGLLSILKSFELSHLRINLDTGNNSLNGIIFPFFFLISYFFKTNICVNFVGKNSLKIILKNNLARLSWAFFSSK